MPGVLLRALSEYSFVGTPLWRMSDGKDLVRAELTFHKALPTKSLITRGGLKAGGSLHPLLASGLASLFQLQDHRHAENRDRAGDATTTTTDYNTDAASDHQTTLQEYSYHHRIADYHQTSTSTSVSRVTAVEEAKKKVSRTSERPPNPVLLRRL